MFSIVGFLGMTGIIINDSIVLVTTIDEYAEERGLIPAIIDGASDRLRPVLLTTLTTVLGLAPLLYEGSNQAEFLKPTVITLVYGLGFGMFLVLLIVPALMAMQMDVGSQIRTFRRSLAMGRRAPLAVWASRIGVIAIAAAFAATLGWSLVFGEMYGPLAALGSGGLAMTFGVFAGLSAAALVAIYVLTSIAIVLNRRRGSAA